MCSFSLAAVGCSQLFKDHFLGLPESLFTVSHQQKSCFTGDVWSKAEFWGSCWAEGSFPSFLTNLLLVFTPGSEAKMHHKDHERMGSAKPLCGLCELKISRYHRKWSKWWVVNFKDALTSQIPWVFLLCGPKTPGWRGACCVEPLTVGKPQGSCSCTCSIWWPKSYLRLQRPKIHFTTVSRQLNSNSAAQELSLCGVWTLMLIIRQCYRRESRPKSGQKKFVQPQIEDHCSLGFVPVSGAAQNCNPDVKYRIIKNTCGKERSTSVEEALGWKTGVSSFMVTLVLSFSRGRAWKQKVASMTEVISGKLGRIWRLF